MWRLKTYTEQQIDQKYQRKNLKIHWDENGNTTYRNVWEAAKVILRKMFIAILAYLKTQNKMSNNLILHLKPLEKEKDAQS